MGGNIGVLKDIITTNVISNNMRSSNWKKIHQIINLFYFLYHWMFHKIHTFFSAKCATLFVCLNCLFVSFICCSSTCFVWCWFVSVFQCQCVTFQKKLCDYLVSMFVVLCWVAPPTVKSHWLYCVLQSFILNIMFWMVVLVQRSHAATFFKKKKIIKKKIINHIMAYNFWSG